MPDLFEVRIPMRAFLYAKGALIGNLIDEDELRLRARPFLGHDEVNVRADFLSCHTVRGPGRVATVRLLFDIGDPITRGTFGASHPRVRAGSSCSRRASSSSCDRRSH